MCHVAVAGAEATRARHTGPHLPLATLRRGRLEYIGWPLTAQQTQKRAHSIATLPLQVNPFLKDFLQSSSSLALVLSAMTWQARMARG